MLKNIASQKLAVLAWDGAAGAAKTGDAANITAQISKDGAACAASDDTNPTELDATDAPGVYLFDLTQAETNADLVVLQAASATANIIFRPVIIYTETVLIDGVVTRDQVLKALLAFIGGIAAGGGTEEVKFKNQANDKDVITLTGLDRHGNRTSTTLDFT